MSKEDSLVTWMRSKGLAEGSLKILETELQDGMSRTGLEKFRNTFPDNEYIVYSECVPTHFLAISVTRDNLSCYLTLIGIKGKVQRLQILLEGVLSSVGIERTPEIDTFLTEASKRDMIEKPYVRHLLLRGQAPAPPKPASVKLLVLPYTGKPRYKVDEDGKVDYTKTNLFQNIVDQQHIADYVPPIPGKPGKDIFGRAIPVTEVGNEMVRCGQGVVFEEETKRYFSSRAGYLIFEDNTLRVEDLFVVHKNVDYSTGNINFISNVQILGDIMPDFSVRSSKNIEIHGCVTGSQVEADNDIQIFQGVSGQSKAIVKCGGKLTSRFLNDCRCEVKGDIEVTKEILNSKIFGESEIHAADASVIGGRIVSVSSMHIETLGSHLGYRTEVFLGESNENLQRSEAIRSRLLKLIAEIEEKTEEDEDLIEEWQKPKDPGDKSVKDGVARGFRRRMKELMEKFAELEKVKEEYEQAMEVVPDDRKPKCRVKKIIHPGVRIFARGCIHEVKDPIPGPVIIEEVTTGKGQYRINIRKPD